MNNVVDVFNVTMGNTVYYDTCILEKGDSALYSHLVASGNIVALGYKSYDPKTVLCRPIDLDYAISWIKSTRYLSAAEKDWFAEIFTAMKDNSKLWISFRKG